MNEINADEAIGYATRLRGQENLSPNELRIIALADALTHLRAVDKARKAALNMAVKSGGQSRKRK